MMMATDEERREIARKLRDRGERLIDMGELAEMLGFHRCSWSAGVLADRIADLIEPQTSEQTNPQESSLSASLCDRDERREVARRLRELEQGVIGALIPTRELAEGILRAIDYGHSGAMTPYGCLADLIEPSEPKAKCVAEVKVDGERLEELVHDAAVELTGIDRDALLELADWMDRDVAETEKYFANVISTRSVSDYARRIREACGVEE